MVRISDLQSDESGSSPLSATILKRRRKNMQIIKRHIIREKVINEIITEDEKKDIIIFKAFSETGLLSIFNLTKNKIICAWTKDIEERLSILPAKINATEELWKKILEWMKEIKKLESEEKGLNDELSKR